MTRTVCGRRACPSEAMVDAIHVAALFNMIVRLADSLGWDVPTWESCLDRGEAMLSRGYALDPT